jgi:glutamate-ammonia-ligase adenylyltransferase
MIVDKEIKKLVAEISLNTPDPIRAETNLLRFLEVLPEDPPPSYIKEAARLFAFSQFLSNYCISNPEGFLTAVEEINRPVTRELLLERAKAELVLNEDIDIKEAMKRIRLFRKRYLLGITLRDITGRTDIRTSMDELTSLAEVIIDLVLGYSLKVNLRRFGEPSPDGGVALIGLGKLGGAEINYSSDVDLIAVYGSEQGQTSGVLSPAGIRLNRISNHEFYCKVIEMFTRLLSSNTEDGIAYRVDLRLRPHGQKGEVALPVKSYQMYYESWGRMWERMVLIRARPVAGDMNMAGAFMETIKPFVWKGMIDYSEIDEIRAMKKKIDSTLSKDDIKRGYGGIREVEFFVQTFQLIYSAEQEALRTHRLFDAIQGIKKMAIVPEEDLATLWENYLYFRRLEHYLQMKDDLQTHAVPTSEEELNCLGRKMGFPTGRRFLSDLRLRRMQVKTMYNSLLGTKEDIHAETLMLLEGDLSDEELAGYLSFRRLKDPQSALMNLKRMKEHLALFRTQKERTIIRKVLPELLEEALRAESPDRVLSGLESFFSALDVEEAHLTGLREQRELLNGIVKLFSLSTYLTRVFLSSRRYLDRLIEQWAVKKSLRRMQQEIERDSEHQGDFQIRLSEYKSAEELRVGILFLMGVISVHDLQRYLSHLADAVIGATIDRFGSNNLSVFALGKLGGREITFGSDLDIIFLSGIPDGLKAAEQVVKTLTAYTDRGALYSIDVRLRPDGSKGVLVKDVEGYRDYYLKSAHNWEIQALLKARPVGGDIKLQKAFMKMAREIILKRGAGVRREDIREMRKRIIQELSHEAEGIDIKLGPGGIEDIEFYIQWLQLQHAKDTPEVLVQNTANAISRLAKKGILNPDEREVLFNAYNYYRRLETFLRLNEEHAVVKDTEITELAGVFMGHRSKEEFLSHVEMLRNNVLGVINLN